MSDDGKSATRDFLVSYLRIQRFRQGVQRKFGGHFELDHEACVTGAVIAIVLGSGVRVTGAVI